MFNKKKDFILIDIAPVSSSIPEGTYPCELCGKVFSFVSSLRRHMKLHSGAEKSHECSVCLRRFREKHHLRGHMLVHMKTTDAIS